MISSQWQLPDSEVNLFSLHPPSPRNEKLWQIRNQTLYQLKHVLNSSAGNNLPVKSSLVIGDLNLSKHSRIMNKLKVGMNSRDVNSWPNKPYIPVLFGLALDQLWLSKSATICSRERIDKFIWSDHYAIKTQITFETSASFKTRVSSNK